MPLFESGEWYGKLKNMGELFKGRLFEQEIIILCVRWYLRYKFSLRDLVEMIAERGLTMSHTTHALVAAACARVRKALEALLGYVAAMTLL